MNNNKPSDMALSEAENAITIQQEWDRLQKEAIAAQRWRLEHEQKLQNDGSITSLFTLSSPEGWNVQFMLVGLLLAGLLSAIVVWLFLSMS